MLTIKIILIVIFIIFAVYIFELVRPSHKKTADARLNTDYAHRGLYGSGIPENSLAAFERAAASGFGIELDLQLSRDSEVMVFHDYSLERMTGRKAKISELTASELSALRLAGTSETIPRLCEVLKLVNGRVPLLIELKGESVGTSLCSKADEILSNYGGAYCIESFNPILLGWYAKHRPEVYRGILYTNVCAGGRKPTLKNLLLSCMAFNIIAKPQFIAYYEKYRTSFPVAVCIRLFNAAKFTWTVRSIESYNEAKASGANTIFEGFIPSKSDITEK